MPFNMCWIANMANLNMGWNDKVHLLGYIDSDQAESADDRRSTWGCCFSLGSTMISWMSRKQTSITLSIAEAKDIATCLVRCEAIWLQMLLARLFDQVQKTTIMSVQITLRSSTVTGYKREQCGSSIFLQRSRTLTFSQTLHSIMKFVYSEDKLRVIGNASLSERERWFCNIRGQTFSLAQRCWPGCEVMWLGRMVPRSSRPKELHIGVTV